MIYSSTSKCKNEVSGHHTGAQNYKEMKASFSSLIIKNHSRKIVVVESTQCSKAEYDRLSISANPFT